MRVTIPGNPIRVCDGEQIGERGGARLCVLRNPYQWGEAWDRVVRLALVDESGRAYRIWHPTRAPKWAQLFFDSREDLK